MVSTINRRDVLKAASVGLVGGLAGCSGGNGGASSGGSIKIGLLAPTSGPYGLWGSRNKKGMQLAVDQVNDSDDLLPDTELELVTKNTKTSPETGQTSARELVQRENADVIAGPVSSAVANVVQAYTKQQGIPHFHGQTAAPMFTGSRCSDHAYRLNPHAQMNSSATGYWAADEFGERTYLTFQDYSYGESVRDGMTQGIEAAGGTVVGSQRTPIAADEFGSIFSDIDGMDLDYIHMGMVGSASSAFMRQASARGIDIPIITQYIAPLDIAELTQDQLDQIEVYGMTRWAAAVDTEVSNQFVDAYESEYNEIPTYEAEMGFSPGMHIAHVFHDVFDRGEDISVENVAQSARDVVFESPRGEIDLRECDHQATPPVRSAQATEISNSGDVALLEITGEHDSAQFLADCADSECNFGS